jgi:hypothetical protein
MGGQVMLRSGLALTCAVATTLSLACGSSQSDAERNDRPAIPPSGAAARGEVPVPIEVRGCLTAADGRFALTALRTASGSTAGNDNAAVDSRDGGGADAVPTTETYQLTGGDESELRQYVGREVRVFGDAEPPRLAEVREGTPAAPAVGTSGEQNHPDAVDRPQPQVKNLSETRLQVRKLEVATVTPTGSECSSDSRVSPPAR